MFSLKTILPSRVPEHSPIDTDTGTHIKLCIEYQPSKRVRKSGTKRETSVTVTVPLKRIKTPKFRVDKK